MKNKIKVALFSVALLVGNVALAQDGGGSDITDVDSLFSAILGWVNSLVPILIGLGFLVFLWGLITYLTAAGDPEKRSTGINIIIMGIVVLFVMVAAWGLVGILSETLGGETGVPDELPSFGEETS
ncbi:MAG: pilin [Patescibacteria group bacterium]